jgi:integrase/recombinase XerD
VFLSWCADQDLDSLAARRVDIELYVRWLQEQRRFKPSTVSRRLSVVVCFYRTCVIDAILNHSPAAHVRRPPVSAESPTLGLSHLQFEAMLVAARTSPNVCDFAQGRPRPAASGDRSGHRPRRRRPHRRADPAQPSRHPHDRNAATRRLKHLVAVAGVRMPRMHPHS